MHVAWNHVVANIDLDGVYFAGMDLMDMQFFDRIIDQIDQGKDAVHDNEELSNMFMAMKAVLAATMG